MTNRANERVLPVSFSRSPESLCHSDRSPSLCHSRAESAERRIPVLVSFRADTANAASAIQDSSSLFHPDRSLFLCHSERSSRSDESRFLSLQCCAIEKTLAGFFAAAALNDTKKRPKKRHRDSSLRSRMTQRKEKQ